MEIPQSHDRQSDTVEHERAHDENIEEELTDASTQAHIPNAAVSVAAPTKAEFDALVAKFNLVLGVLRDAKLLPSS